jgi:predicted metal-dependent hydrolase
MPLVTFGELTLDLQRKPIKNLHISVLPPDGRVRVSLPSLCQTQLSGWLLSEG